MLLGSFLKQKTVMAEAMQKKTTSRCLSLTSHWGSLLYLVGNKNEHAHSERGDKRCKLDSFIHGRVESMRDAVHGQLNAPRLGLMHRK